MKPFSARLSLVLFTAALGAQTTKAPLPADPVIKVTVDLVQVDATVTDANGRHVPDLTPADFELLEDGKIQRVTHFSYVRGRGPNENRGRETVAEAPSLVPEGRVQPLPREEQVARSLVLMADDLGIAFSDMPRIKAAMRRFVGEGLQPSDMVSVLASSGGTGALQRFTRDRAQLLAAVERLHWIPGRLGISPFQAVSMGDPTIANAMARVNAQLERSARAKASVLGSGTLGSIRYAIQGLRSMPGRRALVIVSEGLNYSPYFDDVVDLANRAGVVIDVIDARGVVYYGLTAADDVHVRRGGNPMRDIQRAERTRAAEFSASRNGLAVLARGTGGILAENTNDVTEALARVVADSADYYLLGYSPQRPDYGTAFHSIQVKMLRPGLHVRTRSGFLGSPDFALPAVLPTRAELMRQALLSPFQGDVSVRLRVLHSAGDADAKTGRRETILRGRLEIDPRGIRFDERADGFRTAELDIAGCVVGVDGKMQPGPSQTYKMALNPTEYTETMAAGLFYQLTLAVPKPGPVQFLVALRDPGSGKTGSASAFVDVPDYSARRLSLSSIELGEVGAHDHIRHTFRAGAALEFAADVYGARRDGRGHPQVNFAVRLHRGPELIFTGKQVPVHEQSAEAQPIVSGEIRLPAFLPPGEYAVELLVYDRLGDGKAPAASQWAEFTLEPPATER